MKYHYMNILYRNIVLEKYDEIDKTFRVVCYIYFTIAKGSNLVTI